MSGEASREDGQVELRVGLDLVRVADMFGIPIAEHGKHYLRRIYTVREIEDCGGPDHASPERPGRRFAAKEATIKVLARERRATPWAEIELVRSARGPDPRARGACAEFARSAGLAAFAVSITHEGDLAAAVVVGTSIGAVIAYQNLSRGAEARSFTCDR